MIAIGCYVRFLFRDGSPTGFAWQNFAEGRSVVYLGTSYLAVGFGFSGSSFDIEANSIGASLTFGLNQLSRSTLQTAADGRWLVEVRTTWLDDTFAPQGDWTVDIYEALGLTHNNIEISLRLGSPLDAVTAQCPRLKLTQSQVGSLPPSGNLTFS
jgi:hypothetical protein